MSTAITPIANLSFEENESILHIKIRENAEMNLENAKAHYSTINELVKNKKYLALVESSEYFTMEKEAWQFASGKNIISNRVAVAHYNSSLANRLNVSYYKSKLSTAMPLQIFKTKQEALHWLKSFSTVN
ncbi:MAG: hypothetical protein JWO32_569 [Bacteroidetes bacterium]|jgi:hypothetical protein|nr:hypothetical protein [Bacteroidota bacterium]